MKAAVFAGLLCLPAMASIYTDEVYNDGPGAPTWSTIIRDAVFLLIVLVICYFMARKDKT